MRINSWHVPAFVFALTGVGTYAYVQHGAAVALTARATEATADANQAHEAATNLSRQLASTEKAAEEARGEAAANEAQATQEREQLEKTQATLAAESRPDLPVALSFRRGLLSAGLVGMIRNTSNRELEFSLDLESPATGRHMRRSIVLNPHALMEIGGHQGWAFAPGQRITLNNPVYRPLLLTVGG
jgi:hypothetical protein